MGLNLWGAGADTGGQLFNFGLLPGKPGRPGLFEASKRHSRKMSS